MSVIEVKVTDQVLKITTAPTLASGGVNETSVKFTFCEKWDGCVKTALFYRNPEECYYAILDENDTCVLPWEVYAEKGTFYFNVFGDRDNTRRTSTTVKYKVGDGLPGENAIPSDPTPSVYEQLVEMVEENKDVVEEAKTIAADLEEKRDSGYFKGDKGDGVKVTATSIPNPSANGTNVSFMVTNLVNGQPTSSTVASHFLVKNGENGKDGVGIESSDGSVIFNDYETNQVSAENGAVFGSKNTLTARNGFVAGLNNLLSNIHGFVVNRNNKVQSICGAVFGDNNVSPETAKSAGQMVVGKNNAYEDGEIDTALFVVGNGTTATKRRNAFIVRTNGNVEVSGRLSAGDVTIDGDVTINGQLSADSIDPNLLPPTAKHTDKGDYVYTGTDETFLHSRGDFIGQIGVLTEDDADEATVYVYCGAIVGWIKIAEKK